MTNDKQQTMKNYEKTNNNKTNNKTNNDKGQTWTTLTILTNQRLIQKIIAEFELLTWSCSISIHNTAIMT